MKKKIIYAFTLICGLSVFSFAGSNKKCCIKSNCKEVVFLKENKIDHYKVVAEEAEAAPEIFAIPKTL